jgi:acyl-coenzyme A thioesterase PaaI-like protein
LNARYFVPVQESRLEAVGKVVRRGKKIIYVECVIRDFEGRLVAKTSSSCLIQPK